MKFRIFVFAILLLCFSLTVTALDDTNLTSYWSFNSPYSSAVQTNSSVGGYIGTVSSAVIAVGIINDSYNFTSATKFIQTDYKPQYADGVALTWSFWMKPGATPGTCLIDYCAQCNSAGDGLRFEYSGTKLKVNIHDGSIPCSVTSLTAPPANSWTHIVFIYNGSECRLYLNGTKEANTSKDLADVTGTVDGIQLGTYWENSGQYVGLIDEFATFSRELSDADILSLYNSGVGQNYPFIAMPVIQNSTYNLTSAASGQNSTAWRNGNESWPIVTRDTTPTVMFNTTNAAHCRIHTQNQNWTTMGGTRNCTTTGNTAHTCTLTAADALTPGGGYQSLYIGCADATYTLETTSSTSGALNVSLDLYEMIGTAKDQNGVAVNNSYVSVIDQSTGVLYENTTSNATGDWNFFLYAGNWTVVGAVFYNNSLQGDIETFVEVP